jgi:hypothetical protein
MRDAVIRFRYRHWPDHLLGEILSKRWTETAIPVIVLVLVAFVLNHYIHNFLSPAALADTARQAGEIGFIALGMASVVIVGGIDLSVGSMFALTDLCALYTLDVLGWPIPVVILATLACGFAGRGERLADRAFALARLHHDAHHAHHLPFAVRYSDPALFEPDRRGVARHSVRELHWRRGCLGGAERHADLRDGRHIRSRRSHAASAGVACLGDRRVQALRV